MQRFSLVPLFTAAVVLLIAAPAGAQDAAPGAATAASPAVMAAPPAPAPAPEPAKAPVVLGSDAEEAETFSQMTLIGGDKVEHGGYGGPFIRFGRIAARDGVWVGGKGGWIINHHFVIGGAGVGLVNQPSAPGAVQRNVLNANEDVELDINMGYGGLMLEYFIAPKKLIHGTVSMLAAGGSIGVNQSNRNHMNTRCRDGNGNRVSCDVDNRYSFNDNIFVLEPEVGVEANITSFFRINAGATYRFVTGVGGIGFENDDARGFTGSLTLRFGSF